MKEEDAGTMKQKSKSYGIRTLRPFDFCPEPQLTRSASRRFAKYLMSVNDTTTITSLHCNRPHFQPVPVYRLLLIQHIIIIRFYVLCVRHIKVYKCLVVKRELAK